MLEFVVLFSLQHRMFFMLLKSRDDSFLTISHKHSARCVEGYLKELSPSISLKKKS